MKSHDPGKTDHAEKELSQIYQSLHTPEAGNATDKAILHFARQRVLVRQSKPESKRINWTGGFSVAASILVVSVLYWTQFTPESREPFDPVPAPQLATIGSVESDVVTGAESKVEGQGSQLSRVAEPQVLAKLASRSQQGAIATRSDDEVELATLDLAETQVSEPLAYAEEEALSLPPRLARSGIKEKNVSLEPGCQLSLQDGYKLSSTSLAEYTQDWELADKTWLVNQLNRFRSFAMITDAYPGENLGILKSEGLADAYAETLESLKNCKKTTKDIEK